MTAKVNIAWLRIGLRPFRSENLFNINIVGINESFFLDVHFTLNNSTFGLVKSETKDRGPIYLYDS